MNGVTEKWWRFWVACACASWGAGLSIACLEGADMWAVALPCVALGAAGALTFYPRERRSECTCSRPRYACDCQDLPDRHP